MMGVEAKEQIGEFKTPLEAKPGYLRMNCRLVIALNSE
jgi:hypothetical protein